MMCTEDTNVIIFHHQVEQKVVSGAQINMNDTFVNCKTLTYSWFGSNPSHDFCLQIFHGLVLKIILLRPVPELSPPLLLRVPGTFPSLPRPVSTLKIP